jgi:hypothetical protein
MQFSEQMTHDLLGVVSNNPINWPMYPNATQDPQYIAPRAVSQLMFPLRIELIDPGNSDKAATENRATANVDASTP